MPRRVVEPMRSPVITCRVTVLLACLAMALAACARPSPPTPSPASPAASPSTQPGAIEHKTGPTDVLLRVDEGGGFVPMEFFATQAPWFTLYGDGTIVARAMAASPPQPQDGLVRGLPFRTGRVEEPGIQALLADAILRGGLGTARLHYDQPNVADAGSTTFELHAGGIDKTVNVYALGIDAGASTDASARAAFAGLVERLRALVAGQGLATAYEPAAYRATLGETFGGEQGQPRVWPWPDIPVADFKPPANPNGANLPRHRLTPAQATALGVPDLAGGVQRVLVKDPSGQRTYSLSLRPLLPDELE